ncbi:VOC family protein [Wenxinia marina]|uniref:Wenxma_12, whole genome shotgun sequence n=1 Tax=Wenxinia marina DSM 24838 TaxID=1123501 RepID=A0A0D0Q258_9RHOB|nr:VOC family protein [Wenxinia marina]KIQ68614.1 Lactoylglutathione lyase [Wenxinia marina DSM 24838]GGL67297.1 glutathione transferase FosA [Wenxinia marina]
MITGVNHVTLAVADLDRSLGFWQGVLGGRVRARWARGAYLELGTLWLCLAVGPVSAREDYTHLALSCAPGHFDRLAERLRAAAPEWQENRSEGASVYVLDPDGHRVELHAGDLESRLAHYRAHPETGVTVT